MHTFRRLVLSLGALGLAGALGLGLASCTEDGGNGILGSQGFNFDEPDVEIDLTASVFDWEVLDGETTEVWGYNGQYPGPVIRVTEGQQVRVNLTNNLPEATTIHWHGLDVPNDQDGVPGITQPAVEPGATWTYEFVPERVGTTMYHTHTNTAAQLAKGMFGFFIVEPRGGLDYDREYALGLHEINGLYTINGHSFPSTLETDMLKIRSGERVLIRLANMGSLHHPMHLHGHQFQVVNIDGNTMPPNWKQNTVDVPPGQTVDVVVTGENPGTWTFHCHIVPHVTNHGEYPGGMLTLLDYEDDTSYFEEQQAAAGDGEEPPPAATPTQAASADGAAIDATLTEWAVGLDGGGAGLTAATGDVTIDVTNGGATFHELIVIKTDADPANLPSDGVAVDLTTAGEVIDRTSQLDPGGSETLSLNLAPGTYALICNLPAHYQQGMHARLLIE